MSHPCDAHPSPARPGGGRGTTVAAAEQAQCAGGQCTLVGGRSSWHALCFLRRDQGHSWDLTPSGQPGETAGRRRAGDGRADRDDAGGVCAALLAQETPIWTGMPCLLPPDRHAGSLALGPQDAPAREHAALVSMADAVYCVDPAGRVTFVNPAFEAMTGYAAGRPPGGLPRPACYVPEAGGTLPGAPPSGL